ncbi:MULTISPECIES: hypothetical protein [Bradyrhizobium]|uniref:hypothetical protein n=1 Tax=Bradyrhizobium TaxID=374 RepID=UPI0009EF2FDE|nr:MULTISPECIES: hypothetical protein [Bradyrhizobium]
MNFQVTVLKILESYPGGFAAMADLKRDMAILATSGSDWAKRTKRLGSRVPDLDIFSQGLVERLNGGWRITDKGRAVLALMEARPAAADEASAKIKLSQSHSSTAPLQFRVEKRRHGRERRERRRAARQRARANAS